MNTLEISVSSTPQATKPFLQPTSIEITKHSIDESTNHKPQNFEAQSAVNVYATKNSQDIVPLLYPTDAKSPKAPCLRQLCVDPFLDQEQLQNFNAQSAVDNYATSESQDTVPLASSINAKSLKAPCLRQLCVDPFFDQEQFSTQNFNVQSAVDNYATSESQDTVPLASSINAKSLKAPYSGQPSVDACLYHTPFSIQSFDAQSIGCQETNPSIIDVSQIPGQQLYVSSLRNSFPDVLSSAYTSDATTYFDGAASRGGQFQYTQAGTDLRFGSYEDAI